LNSIYPELKLVLINIEIAKYEVKLKDIKDLIKRIVTSEGYRLGEIHVINTDEKGIELINKEFLSHDYVTDVITFSYNKKGWVSGDLVICLEKIIKNAGFFKQSIKNELIRVIIHGVLHLLKYDDNNQDNRKVMKEKEDYYLRYFENLYV
jgi:rRNA maturation RNase YbeY